MKKLLLSIALGGTLLIGEAGVYSGNTSSSFNYKFEIKTNSINPIDEAAGYYYKENMIDKYEKYFFTLDKSLHAKFVEENLDFFALSDDAYVTKQFGTIHICLGKGNGFTIKGAFRKNECDEEVIREKCYIFDLFK
ncbi:MAG: hypothetical protein PUA56_05110 [Bacillales bacterium]|nr:hypothetical protein [Bacillales bacterium]